MSTEKIASTGNSAMTVERAADILLMFANTEQATLGVSEIALAMEMSKAAVHRILSSLRKKGLVEVDPTTRRYSLGPVTMSLASRYQNKLDIHQLAGPVLAALSRETNETATLSVKVGENRIYIDQVKPNRDVVMEVQVGMAYPLHAGSSSKAFLAYLPSDEIEHYLLQPLKKLTPFTITDRNVLLKELEEVRARGWAQSLEERQSGSASVAAPVLNHLGYPVAVISICGPGARFAGDSESWATQLCEATSQLSMRMGYTGK